MKLRIFESTWRDMPCIRGVAVINKSKKLGVPRRYQKSWVARGELFAVKREEVEVAFKAQAARWEQQTLERIKNGEKPDLQQTEISMAPPPEKIMKAHQYLYYHGRAVWTDINYDQFCKDNGLDGSGGSDLKSDYSADEIALAEKFEKNPDLKQEEMGMNTPSAAKIYRGLDQCRKPN